jgi:hypothetical protein
VDYFQKRLILARLNAISDQEWDEICTRCKSLLSKKLHYTSFGAHSEKELGMPAVDYYLHEAIGKIFSFEWEWKFEKYSIVDQILRIANSLISKNVDKYRLKDEKGHIETRLDDSFEINLFDEVYDDKWDDLVLCIERIIEGDLDLKMLWESIKEGLKSNEIAELFDKPVKYIYRQNEKLIYHAKTKCLTSS